MRVTIPRVSRARSLAGHYTSTKLVALQYKERGRNADRKREEGRSKHKKNVQSRKN